ncbi:hypothetical protein ACL02V_29100 [Bacillus mobilis]|uniref:hypothetical protein n=1 Tax=Bacillus mobilis TaxID=2026190 RepID=UPI0039A10F94
MNSYKLWLDGDEEFKHTELAETPGKAKYQFYKYLQDGIWETDFNTFLKYVRCRKVRRADITCMFGDKKQFERMCELRKIEFAYQGMKIEVCGQVGIIVGSTSGLNLQVAYYSDPWTSYNCHPYYETVYYDKKGNVVADYRKEIATV